MPSKNYNKKGELVNRNDINKQNFSVLPNSSSPKSIKTTTLSKEELSKNLEPPDYVKDLIKKDKDYTMIIFFLVVIIIVGVVFYLIFTNKIPTFELNKDQTTNNYQNLNAHNLNTIICTENWSCDSWSDCSNGVKTKICIDNNKCNTNKSRPNISVSCCNWTCDDWSECYPANFKYRKCIVDPSCKDSEQPNSRENCTYVFPCTDSRYKNNLTKKGYVIDRVGVTWEDNCQDKYVIKVSCDKNANVVFSKYLCDNQCIDGYCYKNLSIS